MTERRLLPFATVILQLILLAPNLIWPYFEDTGSFAATAQWNGRGLALYRDLLDQKPPAFFLEERLRLALLGMTPLAARVFELGLLVIGGWMLGVAAAAHEEEGERVRAFVAVAFAALSSSALWFLPERGQVEFHQASFVCIALGATALALRESENRRALGLAFAAGAASAWSCWLKPQSAAMALAIVAALAVRRGPRSLRAKLVAAHVGAVIALSLAMVVWMAARGQLRAFADVMFRLNPAYTRLPQFSLRHVLPALYNIYSGPRALVVFALGLAGVVSYVRAARAGALSLAEGMLVVAPLPWAVAQFASGGYLFRYHSIVAVVPFALLAGVGGAFAFESLRAIRPPARAALAIGTVLLVTANQPWRDCAGDLVFWASGVKPTAALYDRYGEEGHYFRYAAQVEAARIVRERVPPGQPFYVFGRAGVTYLYADRPPLTRVLATTLAYMRVPGAAELRKEIVDAIVTRPPKILLVRGDDAMPWFGVPVPSNVLLARDPVLGRFVAQNYRRIGRIGVSFLVFEWCDGGPC